MEICRVQSTEEIEETADLADEIWNECYTGLITKEQIAYMVQKFQSPEVMAEQIAHQEYHYILLREEGQAVAYIGLQVQGEQLYLSKIYIKKEFRGRGLAQTMMEEAKALAQKVACKTIWLTVNKGNARAMAAYEKEGFKRVREQCTDIGQGFVMDDYVYEKEI